MNNTLSFSRLCLALSLFGILVITDNINAQSSLHSKSDSLKKIIIADSEKDQSEILNVLSEAFFENGEYDSALFYAQKALEDATKNDNTTNRAHAEKNKAEVYYNLNAYQESVHSYELAIQFYERVGLYEKTAYCHNVIAILYRKQFNYKKAMEHALMSLRIAEEHHLLTRKSSALYNIAMIHHTVLQYDQAIDYYRQSLKVDEILDDTLGMAKTYCNLGICYRAKNDSRGALQAYRQSHLLYTALRDTEGIALTLNNMGVLFLKTGQYQEALESLRSAVAFFERINDIEGQAYAWNGLGDVYYHLGQTTQALEANERALQMTREPDLRKNIYESLSQIYAGSGNYKKAYEYHQLFFTTNDSILNRENSQQLAEIKVRYETEKKEQEIAYLKILNDRQRDNQLWIVSGLIFVSFFAVLLYVSRRRIVNNRKRLGKINSSFLSFGPDPCKNIRNLTGLFREMTDAEYAFYMRSNTDGYEVTAGDRIPNDFPSFFPFSKNFFPASKEITTGDIRLISYPDAQHIANDRESAGVAGYSVWAFCPVKYDDEYRGLLVSTFRRKKKFTREERKIAGILAAAAGTEEERRIAEEALQSSERRYHALFDQSLGFISVHDLNGNIQMVNPAAARSLGYSHEETKGRPVTDFLSPSMKRLFPVYIGKIFTNGTFSGMMRVYTKDGHTRVWIFHNIRYDEPERDPFVLSHALDITELVTTRKEREKLIHDLQRALAKVKTLTGLLPICASCKKIRDDKGYWNQIENYIAVHSDAEFSHGMCPECQRRLYPELFSDDE